MNNEFKRMQELAGVKLQENYELDEAAAEDLELKSLTKQLYSFAKKNGAQAALVDYSEQENPKKLGSKIKDTTKPTVFISLSPNGEAAVTMIGSGTENVYKDMVNHFSKFEFSDFNGGRFTIKSKTTGKKGGVMATEALNEHYIAGGIVGVGAINNPFEGRKKESYEDAFEYFLEKKYSLKEAEEEKGEVNEAEEDLYMKLKNALFPLYTDLRGEERVKKIDEIIKELKEYISILQNEKTAKQS